jgi:hypothetical protein
MPILGITASSRSKFTPASITGLKAWYDAADTSSISLSGSDVTQWNDKSANAYNLTQGTSARRPSSGVNTLNGRNVITFGGDDILVASTAADWKFLHDSSKATWFIVCYFDTVQEYDSMLNTADGSTQIGMYFYRLNDVLGSAVFRGVSGTNVWGFDQGSLPDSSARSITLYSDTTNATANLRVKYKLNGGSWINPSSGSTQAVSTSNPTHALYVGATDTAGSNGLNGRIAEIIIYTGLLSDTDVDKVNTYLTAKWGL